MGENRKDRVRRPAEREDRAARLAAAMRENLRRRKEQQRARENAPAEGSGGERARDIEEP